MTGQKNTFAALSKRIEEDYFQVHGERLHSRTPGNTLEGVRVRLDLYRLAGKYARFDKEATFREKDSNLEDAMIRIDDLSGELYSSSRNPEDNADWWKFKNGQPYDCRDDYSDWDQEDDVDKNHFGSNGSD